MNNRDINYHFDKHKDFIASENEDNKIYFTNKALASHALVIYQVLGDIARNAGKLKLTTEKASNYMLYGFARRALMLFHAYHSIVFTIPPLRKKTITFEESIGLNANINLIYINIMGAMDNLAWSYLCEKEPELFEKLEKSPMQIGFFKKKIKNQVQNTDLWADIGKYDEWYQENATQLHTECLYILFLLSYGLTVMN